jgi:hypothetical protein
MFFYKLRKVIREKRSELLRSSSVLAFIASFIPFFPFLFIYQDDFSRSEKKQMFFISAICLFINLTIIYFIDFFGFNIIFSLILGSFFSFCLYLIPFLILMFFFEFSELKLDKDEIREVKLNSLFRKLF